MAGLVLQCLVVSMLVAAPTACSGEPALRQPSTQTDTTVLTPEALVDQLDARVGTTVRVVGTLKNDAANYFTRPRRFVLIGESGAKLPVKSWLPMGAVPSRGGTAPEVMSDYLDQRVELTGVLIRNESKDVMLEVKSARKMSGGR